jgi:hypothetical protein
MNLNAFNVYQNQTNTFTNHDKLVHSIWKLHWGTGGSTLAQKNIFALKTYPDIVVSAHLEWVRTIKSTYPNLSFKYIHPHQRKPKTLRYLKKLGAQPVGALKTLLKI